MDGMIDGHIDNRDFIRRCHLTSSIRNTNIPLNTIPQKFIEPDIVTVSFCIRFQVNLQIYLTP